MLVIGVLVLLVLVGAHGLGGQARASRNVERVARRRMDDQFEKPRDEGDLL
ncbi:MAG TPA: hypothetical protein VF032_20190 [Thermoleophilaceae bacterium]